MKYILVLFLLLGCNKKCKNTEDCRLYGQCIDAPNNRCITGCETSCKEDGLCTPHHHGDRVECVAEGPNDCKDTEICYFDGLCTPKGGRCVAETMNDCLKSLNCRWNGNCTPINGVCHPISQKDCERSMECSFSNKCFLSMVTLTCITAEEFNNEYNK